MGTFQGRPALIFAAAPETEYGYLRELLARTPDACIVCADGGLRHARALGLTPDLMVSDCDSMEDTEGGEVLLLKPEKDDTDTQSCLREVIHRGASGATLLCATGGRIDHMLANLSLLEEAQAQGLPMAVLDRQNHIVLHSGGRQTFKTLPEFRYFSIVPLDAVLEDVTIAGAKYPLTHATVHRAGMITVSNEALAPMFDIEIGRGRALVLQTRD